MGEGTRRLSSVGNSNSTIGSTTSVLFVLIPPVSGVVCAWGLWIGSLPRRDLDAGTGEGRILPGRLRIASASSSFTTSFSLVCDARLERKGCMPLLRNGDNGWWSDGNVMASGKGG